MKQLFDPGFVVLSAGVLKNMLENPVYQQFVMDSLRRHVRGDWGAHDQYINGTNDLTQKNSKVYSAYERREPVGGPDTLIDGDHYVSAMVIVITTALGTPQTEVASLNELMFQ